MASLFGSVGNPFATKVGRLIDQATDANLSSENWALNIEICDVINETEEGPKDAIRAIKKKLNANAGKNYAVIMYALTVLETCVKNCHKRFHIQVANKDFLGEMIKIISPKNDPPTVVQEKVLSLIQNGRRSDVPVGVKEKVLSLIQTWADAFRGVPELKEVDKVYQDLKKKGIEFPMTDLDSMAPIHTPARTHEPDPAMVQTAPTQIPPTHPPQRTPTTRTVAPGRGGGPVTLTPEQLAKMKSELDVVKQNLKVFSEMLTEMTPGQEESSDLELLQELNRTCRSMQQRIVELLDSVSNEEVTNELLKINDDMNNVFLRYERFERYRIGQASPGQGQAQTAKPGHEAATLAVRGNQESSTKGAVIANLIDLGDESPAATSAPQANVQQRLAGLSVDDKEQSDEFDMFAQSRQSFDQNQPQPSHTYQAQQADQFSGGLGAAVNAKTAGPSDKPDDYDEMEKWLATNDPTYQSTATSSEFDQFLAERAKEAENLPNANFGDRQVRQMQKEEQDNTLFGL